MADNEGSGFGVLVRQWRLRAGLTQEALAERATVSARAISDLERDRGRLPRLATVVRIAEALGLDAGERTRLLEVARPMRSDAPSLREPASNPSIDVPRTLTPLIGRDDLLAECSDVLRHRDCQLLTLTGPGGVGKTRMAIALAWMCAAFFPDGVVFVDLTTLPPVTDGPATVLSAVARRLGIYERTGDPLPVQLAAALRTHTMLLVLDNFEHLLDARTEVVDLLAACPGLTILVTSRIPLRVRGERTMRIPPLPLTPDRGGEGPAIFLFLDRAIAAGMRSVLDDRDHLAIVQLCQRLDGLPLAIELAAGWCRVLTPSALLTRFDRRLPWLVDGPHDLPTRHRAMRDTIAWSYDLLDPEAQKLFRTMAIFVGPFDLDAVAELVPTADSLAHLALLTHLADVSLLQWQADRSGDAVSMLEMVREFGIEQMVLHGELETLRRRQLAVFLHMATPIAGSDINRKDAAHEWLDRRHANLATLIEWLIGEGIGGPALHLTTALWPYWQERGFLAEGCRWLAGALTCAGDDVDPVRRVEALIGLGTLLLDRGNPREASEVGERAFGIAWQHGIRRQAVVALVIARAALDLGDHSKASRHFLEALELARSEEDHVSEGMALVGLSHASGFFGDIPRAMVEIEAGVRLLRATDDMASLALALLQQGAFLVRGNRHHDAEVVLGEALALFRQLGRHGRIAETLWVLGVAAVCQGDDARALALMQESLDLCRERGDDHGAARPLPALGLLAWRRGDNAGARALLNEAIAMLDGFDAPWERATPMAILGLIDIQDGAVSAGIVTIGEAADAMLAVENPFYLSWCLEGLVAGAVAREQWHDAAMLLGARDAMQSADAFMLPPLDAATLNRAEPRIQAAIGDRACATARAEGCTMRIADAIATVVPQGDRLNHPDFRASHLSR